MVARLRDPNFSKPLVILEQQKTGTENEEAGGHCAGSGKHREPSGGLGGTYCGSGDQSREEGPVGTGEVSVRGGGRVPGDRGDDGET